MACGREERSHCSDSETESDQYGECIDESFEYTGSQSPIKSPIKSPVKTPAHSESPRPAAQKQNVGFNKWLQNKEDDTLSEHSSLCSTRLNTAESDLDPNDFDRMADQIAKRVKKELSLTMPEVKAKPFQERYVPQNYAAKSPSPSSSSSSNLRPASHYCPQCSTLMVPPTSSPMLLIPCGHTVCQRCSKVTSCSVCNNNVTSVASNIMIQQIIVDFEEIKPSNNIHSYKQEACEDQQEEYNSLILRCEVLESESDDIEEKMAEISRKIGKEKTQIKMIENQETNIQRQIEELRQNLVALQQHKVEYEENCHALDAMREQEVMKLKMTAETASELRAKAQKGVSEKAEVKTVNLNLTDQEDVDRDRWRVGNNEWCKCGQCKPMDCALESCCEQTQ
ncbi:hypothetical protein CAPTEDRAFT_218039 [Capitella teleta]|uniref:RING-type domain-containing protein n=1 Tax=Capitella teleta TaxID=283909 RepID=R7TGT6_CAPTE|nr:hypothetical protein CAPTEDRAFT_218039 [Capitella teleta]|eukprot:ELT92909.1 hypothetical protein CAPTEDRAFT_218039 [Capitella teleta]